MSDRVFRIERPDGTYRGSGVRGRGPMKVFLSAADVSRHLKLASDWNQTLRGRLKLADASADVVVEYELREVRRLSTEGFLKERES